MIQYFFSNVKDIPSGYEWKAYGLGYFIWIFILLLLIIIVSKYYKDADEIKRDKIRKFIAIMIVIQEIVKDILHYLAGSLCLDHLPLHLCGISIFFTLWHAFKPNKINREYLYALSMPGAIMALSFPNWTQYPIFHFSSFNSFTIHTWLIMYVVMQLYAGDLKPKFKDLPYTFICVLCLLIPIYFLNKAIGTNFMFINYPSAGSPLVPLYNIFGNGYVIATIALFWVLWILMYIPWIIKNRRS